MQIHEKPGTARFFDFFFGSSSIQQSLDPLEKFTIFSRSEIIMSVSFSSLRAPVSSGESERYFDTTYLVYHDSIPINSWKTEAISIPKHIRRTHSL